MTGHTTNATTILLLGAGGMLGHKLAATLSADTTLRVVGVTRRPVPTAGRSPSVQYVDGIDVLGGAGVLDALLRATIPDVIVNAIGAVKQRDLAEAVDATFYLNATLPHLLALLNPNPNGKVIHFSTDCVFTGDRGQYGDADVPDALDLYGRSKACGEIGYGKHLTLRTSIVGFELENHLGLLSWLFQQPRGQTLSGYTRAIFSGLPTVTLARTVHHVIRSLPTLVGVYNVASTPITKFDLLTRLNEIFDLGHTIVPSEHPAIDRSLDDRRFRDLSASTRPQWDALIAELKRDYDSGPYASLYHSLRHTHSGH